VAEYKGYKFPDEEDNKKKGNSDHLPKVKRKQMATAQEA